MGVVLSASAVQNVGGSSGAHTFSHTFSGQGAAVLITRNDNHNNEVSAVSVGGVALTRQQHAANFTPVRHAEIWAKASGIGTGSLTVSITQPGSQVSFAVAVDVKSNTGISVSIDSSDSGAAASGTWSTSLGSGGTQEALGMSCMCITDPGSDLTPATDNSNIATSGTGGGIRHLFSKEDTNTIGARTLGWSTGNNPKAGASILFHDNGPVDVELTPTVVLLDVESPAAVEVGGDAYQTPNVVDLEVEVHGVIVTSEGPLQVALVTSDKEVSNHTLGGDEGQVLTYHTDRQPSWENSTGGGGAASTVTYDNDDSGLPAADVQAAIDQIAASIDWEDLYTANITGSHSMDRDDAPNHHLTLVGNSTITPASSTHTGGLLSILLIVEQDGTGGRTLAWGGNVTWTDTAPSMPSTAGEGLIIPFFSMDNGANWIAISPTSGGSISELDDIGDVNASSPTDGQVLTWDSTPGEWIAATPGSAGSVASAESFITTPVTMSSANTFYDGASVTLTDAGRYIIIGQITFKTTAAQDFTAKLWDGSSSVLATAECTLRTNTDVDTLVMIGIVDVASSVTYKTSLAGNGTAGTIIDTASNNGSGDTITKTVAYRLGNSGSATLNSGTSFPVSPATGDLFHRTNLTPALYRYDGTRWLCTCQHEMAAYIAGTSGHTATTAAIGRVPLNDSAGLDIYIDAVVANMHIATTNTGSAYWTVEALKLDSANATTSLGTANSSADSANTWLSKSFCAGTIIDISAFPGPLRIDLTKTGSPGTLTVAVMTKHRYVAT